jgi:hypothetical protein
MHDCSWNLCGTCFISRFSAFAADLNTFTTYVSGKLAGTERQAKSSAMTSIVEPTGDVTNKK